MLAWRWQDRQTNKPVTDHWVPSRADSAFGVAVAAVQLSSLGPVVPIVAAQALAWHPSNLAFSVRGMTAMAERSL
jgi:hypothetical protein